VFSTGLGEQEQNKRARRRRGIFKPCGKPILESQELPLMSPQIMKVTHP
jgi:hypothetical protein